MPLYDYHCNPCDQNFEAITAHSEYPRCPECDSYNTKRLLSAPKGYIMKDQTGSSTTPKRFNHGEERRKYAKRDRMTQYYSRYGVKTGV